MNSLASLQDLSEESVGTMAMRPQAQGMTRIRGLRWERNAAAGKDLVRVDGRVIAVFGQKIRDHILIFLPQQAAGGVDQPSAGAHQARRVV